MNYNTGILMQELCRKISGRFVLVFHIFETENGFSINRDQRWVHFSDMY